MVTLGRSYSSGTGYRYGFNGKENDNEVKGTGNQQDYGMRIYDPRLGKFLSVDPIARDYPSLTPYQFASNQPIESIDKDGMERMDYRITLSDGKPQMQLLSTGPSKEIMSGLFGTDFLKETIDIPKHFRVEYNGQHYIFASGGEKSDYVKNMPPQASSFGTAAPIYSVAELWAFQKNPDAFLETLTSEEEFDHDLAFLELGEELGRELNSGLNWGGSKSKTGKTPTVNSNKVSNTTTKTLKVGPYSNIKKENAGKGLSADHIPSFASVKQMREQALGRTLTATEATALKNSTLTLSIKTKLHQSTSLTYGGRNSIARIAADATNPAQAIRDNVNAYRSALLEEGYSNTEIDNAIQTLSAPYQKK